MRATEEEEETYLGNKMFYLVDRKLWSAGGEGGEEDQEEEEEEDQEEEDAEEEEGGLRESAYHHLCPSLVSCPQTRQDPDRGDVPLSVCLCLCPSRLPYDAAVPIPLLSHIVCLSPAVSPDPFLSPSPFASAALSLPLSLSP